MKTCARCKEQKPLDQFNRKTETQLQSFCKPCNKEYQREHYLSNKEMYALKWAKWKKDFKAEAHTYLREAAKDGCKVCGEKDYVCLQFHHINPDTKISTVARMICDSVSLDKVKEEAAKCEILCANCHMRHTAKQHKWYGNF